jgi:hypothetical protein
MSSISLLPSLFQQGNSWRWPFQNARARRGAQDDALAAANSALVRSLLPNAPQAGGTTTPGGSLLASALSMANPLEGNLGNLIDLRATLVTRTEDASLTIKTAEGDTVTLTEHSQLQSLKAQLTYAPGTAPGTPAAGATPASGATAAPARNDGDQDDIKGTTRVGIRQIQLDQSITLSVQGDLSDKELADIKKLVAGLGDSLKPLGDQGGARDQGVDANARPGSLTRLDTQGLSSLAGFELHVEQTVEVTKIHVHRAPAAAPAAAAPDPTAAPDTAPVAGPPVAAEPPLASTPGSKPAPAPGKTPVLGKATPATPSKPATPAWIVDILEAKRTSAADLLFRRWIGAQQPAPTAAPPLPESPAAKA